MIPELLSNGICSLQEGVPRYCKTAWMDYDDNGAVRAEGFSPSVVASDALTDVSAAFQNEERPTRRQAPQPAHLSARRSSSLKPTHTAAPSSPRSGRIASSSNSRSTSGMKPVTK